MGLLQEIQTDAATKHAVPLSDILRKCKILAKRLQHEGLADWTEWELNGYETDDELPPYRRHPTEVRGTFQYLAAIRRNVLIPVSVIDAEYRERLFSVNLRDGVAVYESLLAGSNSDIMSSWPADVVAHYADDIMEDGVLVEAKRTLPRATVEGMLDQVRTRILSFALDIEEANPDAGEAEPGGVPPVPPRKTDQIFITNIYGGTNIVASGSNNLIADFEQSARDWPALEEALKVLGLSEEELRDLSSAIEADKQSGSEEEIGPAVESWLGKLMTGIASGSVVLINNAAGSMIGTLIFEYLKSQ